MLKKLQERRAAIKAELEALLNAAEAESRSLTETEDTDFDAKTAEMRKLDARIAELQEAEVAEARAAAHHVEAGTATTEARARVTSEPNPVYRKDDGAVSFFRDLATSQLNMAAAPEARERL